MITALSLEETRKLRHIQRQGRYHYFRHPLLKLARGKGRLPGEPSSPEYLAEYERLLAIAERRAALPTRADGRPVRLPFGVGTVGWTAKRFMAHDDFRKRRKPGTQVAYRAMIDTLIDSDIARIPLAGLNRQHVRHHCNEVEKTHGASRGDHQAMIISILWDFADNRFPKECKIGEKVNPARSRERTYEAMPRLAWPVSVQRRFCSGAPRHLQLAFALLLFTGQRRGDVCNMRWTDIERDAEGHQWLMVHAQEKTGESVPIPMHRDLRIALAKNGAGHKSEYILVTATRRRYDKTALTKAIQKRLIEIGEKPSKYTLHGLRKAAAVRMAEAGATVQQLMSVFGWKTPTMALYYCREANKRKLNREAWSLWERAA
jgi:integrase